MSIMAEKKNLKRIQKLLAWFDENQRSMPWRETKDLYAIWVSEVMLQQTRVETVIPYYLRWMQAFPTVQSLAAAEQEDVLKLWEGLGYYSRGRNLHKAAQQVVAELNGGMPRMAQELEKLPGIGRYTAAAVASIAYDEVVPVVDGNVKRVLSRWFDFEIEINTPVGEKYCWDLATEIVSETRTGDYNQAMMELGAMICLPKNAQCEKCPVQEFCSAFKNQTVEERPVKKSKKEVPTIKVGAAVMMDEQERVLITKRPQDAMLAGMWEFPGGKQEAGEDMHATVARELQEEMQLEVKATQKLGTYRHAYTHFKVILDAYFCEIVGGELQLIYADEAEWVPIDKLQDYPMGKIDRMISDDLMKLFVKNGEDDE